MVKEDVNPPSEMHADLERTETQSDRKLALSRIFAEVGGTNLVPLAVSFKTSASQCMSRVGLGR